MTTWEQLAKARETIARLTAEEARLQAALAHQTDVAVRNADALAEARAEVERLERLSAESLAAFEEATAQAIRERDEARAEADRAFADLADDEVEIVRLTRERDEALAEVERMRAVVEAALELHASAAIGLEWTSWQFGDKAAFDRFQAAITALDKDPTP